jgi:hypothetical protein
MMIELRLSTELEERLEAQARLHGVSLSDYLQQIIAREAGLPAGPLPTQEKNLSDLLLNSPLAGANLDLDRYHDFPRPIDLK